MYGFRLLVISFIFLFSGTVICAQPSCASLQRLLRQSQPDMLKALRLCLLAECQYKSHQSNSLKTAEQALVLSTKLDYARGMGLAPRFLGSVEAEKNRYASCLKHYEK